MHLQVAIFATLIRKYRSEDRRWSDHASWEALTTKGVAKRGGMAPLHANTITGDQAFRGFALSCNMLNTAQNDIGLLPYHRLLSPLTDQLS